jgi:NAD(P)-dependent dehydrogenase (short-subunit alcohol dehydrogenase family)
MKWLLVTGGGHGIGREIVRQAAAAGYGVAIWDVNGDDAKAVAAELDTSTHVSELDISDEQAVLAATTDLPAVPDALVNNAGAVRFGPLLDLTLPNWETAIRVNLTGTFVVSRAIVRGMIERGSGAIVNISSIDGVAAAPFVGSYSAAKAGVIMLTQHMALEWAQYGVRVNSVAPGLIDAGMSAPIYADSAVREQRVGRVPAGRLGRPEDIAAAVLYVVSDAASYLTAQTIVVDGGITMATLNALSRPTAVDGIGVS